MLAYFLFRISKIDLEIRQIPDEYSLAICILAVGAGGFTLKQICLALGIMTASGFLMGFGDAKLFGALSLLFGWRVIVVFCLSFCLAALYCLVGIIRRSLHARDTIAFAPFISIAALTVLLSSYL